MAMRTFFSLPPLSPTQKTYAAFGFGLLSMIGGGILAATAPFYLLPLAASLFLTGLAVCIIADYNYKNINKTSTGLFARLFAEIWKACETPMPAQAYTFGSQGK